MLREERMINMKIALIAHDRKKPLMIKLTTAYKAILEKHELFATGTTGGKITEATGLKVHRFKSGPLGGDQQIGAMISEESIRPRDFSARSVGCTAS